MFDAAQVRMAASAVHVIAAENLYVDVRSKFALVAESPCRKPGSFKMAIEPWMNCRDILASIEFYTQVLDFELAKSKIFTVIFLRIKNN